jgi:hypothetical protein
MSEWWIGKDFKWSCRGKILKFYSLIRLGDWGKLRKFKDRRSLGRNLNLRPTEYEAEWYNSTTTLGDILLNVNNWMSEYREKSILNIQGDSGGKVTSLGIDSIEHYE